MKEYILSNEVGPSLIITKEEYLPVVTFQFDDILLENSDDFLCDFFEAEKNMYEVKLGDDLSSLTFSREGEIVTVVAKSGEAVVEQKFSAEELGMALHFISEKEEV